MEQMRAQLKGQEEAMKDMNRRLQIAYAEIGELQTELSDMLKA